MILQLKKLEKSQQQKNQTGDLHEFSGAQKEVLGAQKFFGIC